MAEMVELDRLESAQGDRERLLKMRGRKRRVERRLIMDWVEDPADMMMTTDGGEQASRRSLTRDRQSRHRKKRFSGSRSHSIFHDSPRKDQRGASLHEAITSTSSRLELLPIRYASCHTLRFVFSIVYSVHCV
ncbi:hypothetical protein AVEN_47892-1 [Araneus ventricosus]|uniref:Uncharacterized protein n=1 Tax=Araneus ventricosus TaxID=182803 RepID=A0A4Y2W2Y1_ARAVE|nr:hypothetical protein AVEN_47892-1 [Araneus ventricosus]